MPWAFRRGGSTALSFGIGGSTDSPNSCSDGLHLNGGCKSPWPECQAFDGANRRISFLKLVLSLLEPHLADNVSLSE
ncbi:hypothetical protein C1H46_034463 [Malus baccata]|uniref:Uncharacterized protein n=1 Tax=Malus baccata TaxID=106549 RepID=A0A540L0H0_MALBA|nr:hypothetical protein C1H46_034463 [Malus baccata]